MYQNIFTVWGHDEIFQRVVYLARWRHAAAERLVFLNICCSKLKPKSQWSTQTVCLQSWWSSSCNLSPRLKFVPGVCLDKCDLMKVNEVKNKTALLPRTTLLMYTEKICKSKATHAETQRQLSCVLDCIYSLDLTFSRRCVLYLTPDSTHMRPWHFKVKKKEKKLTILVFTVQRKAINWIPVDTPCFRDVSFCKEEVITHNCSNIIWTQES